jgi:hypothetical protein
MKRPDEPSSDPDHKPRVLPETDSCLPETFTEVEVLWPSSLSQTLALPERPSERRAAEASSRPNVPIGAGMEF